jgi:hypothetical protein
MLAFPEASRAAELARLADLPETLRLVLDDGGEVMPEVDRGHTGGSDRLPAVLALRYILPDGRQVAGLAVHHPALSARHPAPSAWTSWCPGITVEA